MVEDLRIMAAVPNEKSFRAIDSKFDKALTKADKDGFWTFHEAYFDNELTGCRPRIVYDGMLIKVYMPARLMTMPRGAAQDYMNGVISAVLSEKQEFDFGPKFIKFMNNREYRAHTIELLRDRGLVFDEEKTDAFLKTCEFSARSILMSEDLIKDTIIAWRLPETTLDKKYIATTSPDAKLITIDTRVGYKSQVKMTYIIFHELCVVASYSYSKDEIVRPMFQALIERFRLWEDVEENCESLGWIFKYTARDVEEERW